MREALPELGPALRTGEEREVALPALGGDERAQEGRGVVGHWSGGSLSLFRCSRQSNAPVQRRAAQRAVRCNRLLYAKERMYSNRKLAGRRASQVLPAPMQIGLIRVAGQAQR